MKKDKYDFFEKIMRSHQDDEMKEPEEVINSLDKTDSSILTIFWKRCFPKESDKNAIWERTIQKAGLAVKHNRGIRLYPLLWKVAALFLLFSSVGLNWYLMERRTVTERRQWISYYTETGQMKEFELPDHSKVWLNSGSSLLVPDRFDGSARHVYLTGEAYFDVAHDKKKRFIVNTQKEEIHVHGTKFSVTAYLATPYTSTILEEGSVEITFKEQPGKPSVFLKPGEEAYYSHQTGELAVREVDASKRTNWKSGDLNFYNDPLPVITNCLEQKYGVKFFFLDKASEEISFSGDFTRSELEEVLSAIEEVGQLSITKQNEVYFIKTKN